MKFKRKITILVILFILVAACTYFFPKNRAITGIYDRFIFYPVQSFRITVLGIFPFSVGDVLYITGGIWALVTLSRWGYYIITIKSHANKLAASVLRWANTVLFVYLIFIFGWGANYYKQPLRKYWGLGADAQHKMDTTALITFNQLLVARLNIYAPHFHNLSLGDINKRASAYYNVYTDCKVKNGLAVKPSIFGNYMERADVEGYYNPFTGEGQINNSLSDFMQPFVVCHEMAHQAGIAAEGDANLMAYALGTTTSDSSFCYSSYLNIWLYANDRLYFHDSGLAKKLESALNTLTRAHLDTLDQINRKYHNDITKYSGEVYDSYLRMENQREGIGSYGNVVSSAWQLEQQRTGGKTMVINIP